ncbi:hypothetical protein [Pseudomonas sp. NA-150]|uniref:hypothetical protein n=1 Tax=Pseudomonas sp. NA-150 TaxID=3367525 RepID=UPI0037C7F430
MNFYLSKRLMKPISIIASLFLLANCYGFGDTSSAFKMDIGNGVTIDADHYVQTGKWVFDCSSSLLISREPIPVPINALTSSEKLAIINPLLDEDDVLPAAKALETTTGVSDWYKNLKYRVSALGEDSKLMAHIFEMISTHEQRQWIIIVTQFFERGTSSLSLLIQPYNPVTHVNHNKALNAAIKSCPVPQ